MTIPRQPLEGLRVLDLSTILAAPTVCSMLGDFGADVVKVERPGVGDDVRRYPPVVEGQSLPWRVLSRNKRSIAIDLHQPDGRRLVRELGDQCDVIVTNFRAETLERWGLDYESWRPSNPEVIFFHLTAFGLTGPWRNKPGFARIAEAFAGLTHITGNADGPPLFPGFPIGDAFAGVYGAFAVMLAVAHRRSTGEGQLIDLGLYEPLVRVLEDLYTAADDIGFSKGRHGNDQDHSCPNGLFPSRDGKWIVLPASSANMWRRLKGVIGDPELDAFDTTPQRVANRSFIDAKVAGFTTRHDAAELIAILEDAEIACGLVNTAADVVAHEQVAVRGNLTRVHDPVLGRELLIQAPLPHLPKSPGAIRRPAPQLGEHTDEILAELLDLDVGQIAQLRESAVIA